MKRTYLQTTLSGTLVSTKKKAINRLKQPIVRTPKQEDDDYVLYVAVSRVVEDPAWIRQKLDAYAAHQPNERRPSRVIVGDSKSGQHVTISDWAIEKGIPVEVVWYQPAYAARWPSDQKGWLGYKMRDYDLVDRADRVLVLWDGISNGVKYIRDYALDTGKPTETSTLQRQPWKKEANI